MPIALIMPAEASIISGTGNVRTPEKRQSDVELLRIVAMIMVMVLHADFAAFGVPSVTTSGWQGWLTNIGRVGAETLSVVSVNVFVLISGWFAIRPSAAGFCKFLFQCFFFFTVTYLVLTDWHQFSWTGAGSCLALGKSNWFVKAYAGLYLLSPLLNMYVEKSTKSQLRHTVIAFFVYQTVWGWIGPNTSVNDGYSAFSFIGLYLLARYLREYTPKVRRCSWLYIYLATAGINTSLFFVPWIGRSVISYANPLVVAGAVSLFMWFATMRMSCRPAVNAMASSAFAAYLLHTSPAVMAHYLSGIRGAWDMSPGIWGLAAIAGVITAYYGAAVCMDRVRLWCWKALRMIKFRTGRQIPVGEVKLK